MKLRKIFLPICIALIAVTCTAFCACGAKSGGETEEQTIEYTLTFDYGENGAGEVSSVKIAANKVIAVLPEPTTVPTGKKFDCWQTQDGVTVKAGLVYTLDKDVTLYAKYAFIEYAISYDVQGGDALGTDAVKVYTMTGESLPLPVPTKTGYEFLGWKENLSATPVKSLDTARTGDISLAAAWQAKKFTITFNYGDGTGAENSREVFYDEIVRDLPLPNCPTDTCFIGWCVESADGTLFANGKAYKFESDLTLYARYDSIDKTFAITYDVNGGTILAFDAVRFYTVSETETELPFVARTGYEFVGWKENEAAEPMTAIPAGKAGDLKLTAEWKAKKYTLSFDFNDGNGITQRREYAYGELVTDLPVPETAPEGKRFSVWKQFGTWTVFDDGTPYTFNKDLSLCAIYADDSTTLFTINYDLNGGKALPESAMRTYRVSDEPIDLPVTSRAGYEFLGWKENPSAETVTAIPAGKAEDLTFTAEWRAIKYTLNFELGDGEGSAAPREMTYGDRITDLPVPVCPAHKVFTGWHVGMETGDTVENGTEYAFTYDLTLYAGFVYDFTTYVINYNLSGGDFTSANAIRVYRASEYSITLPTPRRVGYDFLGWKENETAEPITAIPADTTRDLTLTAEWRIKTFKLSFDYNGGSGEETERVVSYGDYISELPVPTNTEAGKTFDCWQTKAGTVFASGNPYNFESDITLYAIYRADKFVITLKNDTGAESTEWTDETVGDKIVQVNCGEKIAMPPIKYASYGDSYYSGAQYIFNGWYYLDRLGAEREFDAETEFTLENLNVMVYEFEIYAKISEQWIGPG